MHRNKPLHNILEYDIVECDTVACDNFDTFKMRILDSW